MGVGVDKQSAMLIAMLSDTFLEVRGVGGLSPHSLVVHI